jgi:hypothetical protein
MGHIDIRKMRSEDLPACMAILERWNMAPRPPSSEIPDPERSGIEIANGFVAEAEGRIVGTCSYIVHSADLAETASLAVDPASRPSARKRTGPRRSAGMSGSSATASSARIRRNTPSVFPTWLSGRCWNST